MLFKNCRNGDYDFSHVQNSEWFVNFTRGSILYIAQSSFFAGLLLILTLIFPNLHFWRYCNNRSCEKSALVSASFSVFFFDFSLWSKKTVDNHCLGDKLRVILSYLHYTSFAVQIDVRSRVEHKYLETSSIKHWWLR